MKHLSKPVKAVIFDLDGTLVDSMWIWKDIDIAYLKKHNLPLPLDLQKAIEGMSFTETAHYFKTRFSLPDPVDTIKAEWIEMAEDYYSNRIELKYHAREFIQALNDQGILVGVGTSNSRELALMVLQRHNIHICITEMVTSCEVPRGKPAPDVFLKVAERLGIDPEDCLVFEDTHAGVLAALAAGMQVIAVKDAHSEEWAHEIEPLVQRYIADYSEMLV